MKRGEDFEFVKSSFIRLFDMCSDYIKCNPKAKLTYDEISESDPTLGFTHKKGKVTVVTTFTLNREEYDE
jgi:hypothetical protein